jgi:uncharacterized membrane protein YvbJ
MFCKKCGEENPDNAVYCRNCGTKLVEEVKKTTVIETEDYNQNTQNTQTTSTNNSSDNSSDWTSCCICLVAVFIVFAILGILGF